MFRNDQWELTNYGICARVFQAPYAYYIEEKTDRETEHRERSVLYSWPVQIASKNWANIESFIEGL